MLLNSAVSCHIGGRKNNEDNFYMVGQIKPREHLNEAFSLHMEGKSAPAVYAVCDGMGGLSSGEVASWLAVSELERNADLLADSRKCHLPACIRRMDELIRLYGKKTDQTMGAAVVVVRVTENAVETGNVGDCKAFMLTDSGLHLLTVDHTTAQDLRDMGLPVKIGEGHLTQYLGMDEDEFALEPSFRKWEFPKGARLLLCSDGVTQRRSTEEIRAILSSAASPQIAAEELVKDTGPGQDNATALVVERVCG